MDPMIQEMAKLGFRKRDFSEVNRIAYTASKLDPNILVWEWVDDGANWMIVQAPFVVEEYLSDEHNIGKTYLYVASPTEPKWSPKHDQGFLEKK